MMSVNCSMAVLEADLKKKLLCPLPCFNASDQWNNNPQLSYQNPLAQRLQLPPQEVDRRFYSTAPPISKKKLRRTVKTVTNLTHSPGRKFTREATRTVFPAFLDCRTKKKGGRLRTQVHSPPAFKFPHHKLPPTFTSRPTATISNRGG